MKYPKALQSRKGAEKAPCPGKDNYESLTISRIHFFKITKTNKK